MRSLDDIYMLWNIMPCRMRPSLGIRTALRSRRAAGRYRRRRSMHQVLQTCGLTRNKARYVCMTSSAHVSINGRGTALAADRGQGTEGGTPCAQCVSINCEMIEYMQPEREREREGETDRVHAT